MSADRNLVARSPWLTRRSGSTHWWYPWPQWRPQRWVCGAALARGIEIPAAARRVRLYAYRRAGRYTVPLFFLGGHQVLWMGVKEGLLAGPREVLGPVAPGTTLHIACEYDERSIG